MSDNPNTLIVLALNFVNTATLTGTKLPIYALLLGKLPHGTSIGGNKTVLLQVRSQLF